MASPLTRSQVMADADLRLRSSVADSIRTNPTLSYHRIARMHEVGIGYLLCVVKEFNLTRPRGRKPQAPVAQ